MARLREVQLSRTGLQQRLHESAAHVFVQAVHLIEAVAAAPATRRTEVDGVGGRKRTRSYATAQDDKGVMDDE